LYETDGCGTVTTHQGPAASQQALTAEVGPGDGDAPTERQLDAAGGQITEWPVEISRRDVPAMVVVGLDKHRKRVRVELLRSAVPEGAEVAREVGELGAGRLLLAGER